MYSTVRSHKVVNKNKYLKKYREIRIAHFSHFARKGKKDSLLMKLDNNKIRYNLHNKTGNSLSYVSCEGALDDEEDSSSNALPYDTYFEELRVVGGKISHVIADLNDKCMLMSEISEIIAIYAIDK